MLFTDSELHHIDDLATRTISKKSLFGSAFNHLAQILYGSVCLFSYHLFKTNLLERLIFYLILF